MRNDVADTWKFGPVFSAAERGSRIMHVPPGFVPGRISAYFVILAALSAVAACLAVYTAGEVVRTVFGDGRLTGLWWLLLVIPAYGCSVAAAGFAMIRGEERFGRGGIGGGIGLAGMLLGGSFGILTISLVRAGEQAEEGGIGSADPAQPYLLLAAAVCLLASLCLLIRAMLLLRGARKAAARIARIRGSGIAVPGEITALPDERRWRRDHGSVPIRYGDEQRTLTVQMSTLPACVPLPGTRVLVYVDAEPGRRPARSELHIELDPAFTTRFDPDPRRWETGVSWPRS